jgi:hypothetical protein
VYRKVQRIQGRKDRERKNESERENRKRRRRVRDKRDEKRREGEEEKERGRKISSIHSNKVCGVRAPGWLSVGIPTDPPVVTLSEWY